jgi:hypothetical protein
MAAGTNPSALAAREHGLSARWMRTSTPADHLYRLSIGTNTTSGSGIGLGSGAAVVPRTTDTPCVVPWLHYLNSDFLIHEGPWLTAMRPGGPSPSPNATAGHCIRNDADT